MTGGRFGKEKIHEGREGTTKKFPSCSFVSFVDIFFPAEVISEDGPQ